MTVRIFVVAIVIQTRGGIEFSHGVVTAITGRRTGGCRTIHDCINDIAHSKDAPQSGMVTTGVEYYLQPRIRTSHIGHVRFVLQPIANVLFLFGTIGKNTTIVQHHLIFR